MRNCATCDIRVDLRRKAVLLCDATLAEDALDWHGILLDALMIARAPNAVSRQMALRASSSTH
jgi:hypothetical protein